MLDALAGSVWVRDRAGRWLCGSLWAKLYRFSFHLWIKCLAGFKRSPVPAKGTASTEEAATDTQNRRRKLSDFRSSSGTRSSAFGSRSCPALLVYPRNTAEFYCRCYYYCRSGFCSSSWFNFILNKAKSRFFNCSRWPSSIPPLPVTSSCLYPYWSFSGTVQSKSVKAEPLSVLHLLSSGPYLRWLCCFQTTDKGPLQVQGAYRVPVPYLGGRGRGCNCCCYCYSILCSKKKNYSGRSSINRPSLQRLLKGLKVVTINLPLAQDLGTALITVIITRICGFYHLRTQFSARFALK